MSEQPSSPSELDTYQLGDRGLNDWHTWLVADKQTGEVAGYRECPGSRYGSTSGECAWWAIAAQIVYLDSTGEAAELETSIDELMSYAVNDHESIGALVTGHWYLMPAALADHLDLGGEDA